MYFSRVGAENKIGSDAWGWKELWQKRLDFVLRRRWGAGAGGIPHVTLARMGCGDGWKDEVSGLSVDMVFELLTMGLNGKP